MAKIELDYSQIENICVADAFGKDAPDFSDAFIASADYMGREMTESELDSLNEDRDFVHQVIINNLY